MFVRHALRILVCFLYGPAVLADDFLTPAISAAELAKQLEGDKAPLVIDVRTPQEFAYVHLPGAVNIIYTELEQHLDQIRQAKTTVLYCMDGRRTRQAEQLLETHEISALYHLQGSLPAWVQGGFPIEKGKPTARRQPPSGSE